MEKTTTTLTNEYIKEHPAIKQCLAKGIINYSSLSRLIAKELNIEKKSSFEAILIAARRFKEKLKGEAPHEKKIQDILSQSEIDVKNKTAVFIIDRNTRLEPLDELQKKIRKEAGTFYILEGSDSYTIILPEKYAPFIEQIVQPHIIKKQKGLALVNFKSSKDLENVYGVIAYLSSLFAENGVNIVEFISCWTDTLFVIKEEDVTKAITFLKF